MEQFMKSINGIEFGFHGFLEGEEEVCRVSVDNHQFKMIVGEDGTWMIWQQVPLWIKKLEKELAEAIEQAYC
jgi:hypothetical protein